MFYWLISYCVLYCFLFQICYILFRCFRNLTIGNVFGIKYCSIVFCVFLINLRVDYFVKILKKIFVFVLKLYYLNIDLTNCFLIV